MGIPSKANWKVNDSFELCTGYFRFIARRDDGTVPMTNFYVREDFRQ